MARSGESIFYQNIEFRDALQQLNIFFVLFEVMLHGAVTKCILMQSEQKARVCEMGVFAFDLQLCEVSVYLCL